MSVGGWVVIIGIIIFIIGSGIYDRIKYPEDW